MKKAILILDEMPKKCCNCDLYSTMVTLDDFSVGYRGMCQKTKVLLYTGDGRPNWCPLAELPDQILPEHYRSFFETVVDRVDYERYCDGWNACIAKIRGVSFDE